MLTQLHRICVRNTDNKNAVMGLPTTKLGQGCRFVLPPHCVTLAIFELTAVVVTRACMSSDCWWDIVQSILVHCKSANLCGCVYIVACTAALFPCFTCSVRPAFAVITFRKKHGNDFLFGLCFVNTSNAII